MSAHTILLFTEAGPAADIYRQLLPSGWVLESLDSRGDEAEKLDRLSRADVVISADVPLSPSHLDAAGRLKLIQRQGVGFDAVDLDAAEERGIAVCLCPVGTPEAVAEHTILLMLAVGRFLVALDAEVTAGRWPKWDYRGRSMGLAGTRIGIVGFGRIGQAVTERLLAFGARPLIAQRPERTLDATWTDRGVEAVADVDEAFRRSDIVSLHCPLTDETAGMVDRRRLELMPAHAFLINTGRGALVVEDDLVEHLRSERIAGAGLDVTVEEPPPPDHPLRALSNVLLTPHLAAGTRRTQETKAHAVFDNAVAVMNGTEPRFRIR